MKAKLIALNLALVAAIGAIVWQGRMQLHQARTVRRENINVAVKPAPAPPPAPTPKPEAAPPVKYADVATRDLFSKDRNPDVIVEPPKVEAPKPMPPLPVIYGVLGLPSGTKAIMAEKKGADSKPVKTGDTVGEFKIVSLDTRNVVFDWDGKQISKNIDDLIDRSEPAGGAASSSGAAAARGPAVIAPSAAAPPPPPKQVAAAATGPGKQEAGKPDRPCVPGDTSPNGTVTDGYKLSFTPSPFGRMACHWVPVQ